MRAEELTNVFLAGDFDHIFATQENFSPDEIYETETFLYVADSGIFPVHGISSRFNRDVAIVDLIDATGQEIGQLLLTKGKSIDDFYQLGLAEFLAYLADVSSDEFGNVGHVFSKDFVVTSNVAAAEYDKFFRATADIWGGFTHYRRASETQSCMGTIIAMPNLIVPSSHHAEAFSRYTHSQNAFERFLRLYHCIELLFDAVTVYRIKKLGHDIRDLSLILSSHESKEIDRLAAIALEFLVDHEQLAWKMTLISGHELLAKKIFDDYSKHGNPIPPTQNPSRWQLVCSEFSLGRYKETDLKSSNVLGNQDNYARFICRLASYWIYRIRCSIAHNRIGEFILSDTDTDFVRNFGEPLLLEFTRQIFSSENLRNLI